MDTLGDVADQLHGLTLTSAQEMEKAVRAAGAIVRARIAAETSRGATGRTAKAVRIRVTGNGIKTVAKVRAGGFAQILVSGAKPHALTPKNKKKLAFPGGRHPFAAGQHPGLKPDPYVARAIDAAAPDVQAVFDAAGIRIVESVTTRVRR